MKHVAIALLLAATAAGAVAQQSGPAAPQETDIVVPELLLEIEELEVQQVTAVLPDEGDLVLGRVSVLLPGADELSVDEGAFAVPAPGVARPTDAPSVFSSGRLGAGTANHIVGELSLFRLGASPRFRLRFSHEGIDGYQFREAGTGYFASTNVIDGWFSGGTERLGTDVEAAFSEEVHGLQGVSDFYSVGLRKTDLAAALAFAPEPVIRLTGGVDAGMATRIQSVSGAGPVPREQEFAIKPEAEARFAIRAVDIVVSTSYFLRFMRAGELPVYQDVDVLAGVDVEISDALSTSARAGVLWEPGTDLRYPWSLRLEMLLVDALEAHLSGGYRVDRITLADIWSDVPQAGVGPSNRPGLASDGQWYAGIGTRWSGPTGLAFTSGVDFVAHDSVVDLEAFDPETSRFPFIQRSMLSLIASSRVGWRPGPRMLAEAGWTGRFLDTTYDMPTGSAGGAIRVADASQRLTAGAELQIDFFPEVTMPNLGVSGSFAPSDELEFSLEFTDILAPLLEAGRPGIGPRVNPDYPFIQPGFRASLFTRISL